MIFISEESSNGLNWNSGGCLMAEGILGVNFCERAKTICNSDDPSLLSEGQAQTTISLFSLISLLLHRKKA
jgi:hypothetical protein